MIPQTRETSYTHQVARGIPAENTLVVYPEFTTVTTDATAGALTYTADMILGGLILRDPAGAGRSDVTPTGTLLLAGLTGVPKVGQSGMFSIVNTADAAETITVTAGTDVTLKGVMTIAQNAQRSFVWVYTGGVTFTVAAIS